MKLTIVPFIIFFLLVCLPRSCSMFCWAPLTLLLMHHIIFGLTILHRTHTVYLSSVTYIWRDPVGTGGMTTARNQFSYRHFGQSVSIWQPESETQQQAVLQSAAFEVLTLLQSVWTRIGTRFNFCEDFHCLVNKHENPSASLVDNFLAQLYRENCTY